MMTYKIRLGGTHKFVSSIGIDEAKFVDGWNNPAAIVFLTKTSAETAKKKLWEIDPLHTHLEEM